MRTIFVFGSNREGRHGKGAAFEARQKWGAIYGQASGLQGNSYAIVTKELRPDWPMVSLDEIAKHVQAFQFFATAGEHDDMEFLVTPIGCGLAGYHPDQIGPMFKWALTQPRVILPREFEEAIYRPYNERKR